MLVNLITRSRTRVRARKKSLLCYLILCLGTLTGLPYPKSYRYTKISIMIRQLLSILYNIEVYMAVHHFENISEIYQFKISCKGSLFLGYAWIILSISRSSSHIRPTYFYQCIEKIISFWFVVDTNIAYLSHFLPSVFSILNSKKERSILILLHLNIYILKCLVLHCKIY